MATIEERAKELYPKGVGVFTPAGAELLQKAYVRGATYEHEILIDKAWKWMVNRIKLIGSPMELHSDFCKAMEELI